MKVRQRKKRVSRFIFSTQAMTFRARQTGIAIRMCLRKTERQITKRLAGSSIEGEIRMISFVFR